MMQYRRFILITVFLLTLNMSLFSQAPDPYPAGSKINYVRVWESNVPEKSGTALMNRPMEDVTQATQYFDGLGRTIQTVVKKGSLIKNPNNPNNEIIADLVNSNTYDKLGRQQFQYLPFVANATNGNTNIDNGGLKMNPFQQQAVFMQTQLPGESYFYNKNEFESSPLSRVTKSMGAGTSWVGSNRGVELQNSYNTFGEDVRVWNIDFATGSVPYIVSTIVTYPEGKLSKSIMIDEKGKRLYTYTDFDGKVILKKVQQEETGPGLDEYGHAGWLCTYYVYDDLGQLRSTITPKAVKYLLNNSWVFASNDVYQELCFWYEFDERGRAIVKHTAGGGKIFLVYDNKDRLVLSQDENQRNRSSKQWAFYLYDNLDRTVATGLYDNSATRDVMAEYVKNLNNGTVSINVYTGANESLKVDNPVAGSSGYCNSCANTVINSINYFDDYSYTGAKTFNSNFNFASTSNPYVENTVQSLRVIGFSTGVKTRVINENHDDNNPNNDLFLVSTVYYDDKGRTVQGLTDNIKNAVDYSTIQYDFSGKTLSVCDRHTMPGTSVTNFQTISKYEYDKLSRLTVLSKQYASLGYKKLAEYSYDELGRVKVKKLSPDYNSGTGIESFRYDYNVRGWLEGINKDYVLANTSLNQWDHFFGMYMGYDNRDNKFTDAQYNGNLTGAIWKTQGDNMPRRYDYTYDNANRFVKALFVQKEKPTDANWNNTKMDFSVTEIVYDENNNLKQMFQKGIIPGNNSPVYIDKLVYDYKQVSGGEWSNQLRRVFDQTTDLTVNNNGSLGDFKDESYGTNGEDYVFDANGNLVKDNNKKIRISGANGVIYNFMDKPQKITIENKSITEFIFDASGNKLGKKVTYTASSTSKTTWYMGDFVYEESNAQVNLVMILHEEGRIRVYQPLVNARITQGGNFDLPDNKKGVFEFFVKDNLENTRMVLTEEFHSEFNNCTMESANAFYEERMFGQVDANGNPVGGVNEVVMSRKARQTVAAGWNANTSATVSGLAQGDKKVGPNIILKVMAGDNITAKTDYYYTGTPVNSGNNDLFSPLLTTLLSALSTTAPTGGLHGSAGNITTNYGINPGELGTFLNNQNSGGNATPQAYMNVMFFDENFNFVPYDNVTGLGSYAWRVAAPGDGQSIPLQLLKAPKNGYAFVYLSNVSQLAVYFDNFEVTHVRGRITEENAYYPYGLKIKGLSAKAFDKGENKYGYQGSFSEELEETGWDEFGLRMYDPQIGNWTAIDPYDEFASPYLGMGANPINLVDPSGGSVWDVLGTALTDNWVGTAVGAISGATLGYFVSKNAGQSSQTLNTTMGFFGGAILGNLTQSLGYSLWDIASDGTSVVQLLNSTQHNAMPNFETPKKNLPKDLDVYLDDKAPVKAGVIKFVRYQEYENKKFPDRGGVDILITYHNFESSYSDFQWIQNITTNSREGQQPGPYPDKLVYNDPNVPNGPQEDYLPFYFKMDQNPSHTNGPGFTYRFQDGPNRSKSIKNIYFEAELTLVAKYNSGAYKRLITIKYGFMVNSNGEVGIKDPSVVSPSSFTLKTVLQANKGGISN